MSQKEPNFFQSINPNSTGFSKANAAIAIMVLLLLVALGFIFVLASNKYSSEAKYKAQDEQIKALKDDSLERTIEIDELLDKSDLLESRADSLLQEKDRLLSREDSLQNLIAYYQRSAVNYKNELARVQQELKTVKAKLADIQKKYDEVVALNNSTLEEYRNQVDQLNLQLESYEAENKQLRDELSKYEGNADNRRALFTTLTIATPGRIRRNRFSPEYNDRRVELVDVKYRLSRTPNQNEQISVKMFDPNNTEVEINVTEKNEVTSEELSKDRQIKPVNEDYRFQQGTYTVKVFAATDGGNPVEIGSARFELK